MGRNKLIGKIREENFKNVLIVRFSALGDVAMTIPVVYSVCMENPSTRFVMITQPMASNLFINPPQNLIVKGVDVKEKYHGITGLYHLFKSIVNEFHIDAFVDLHSVLRTKVISFFCFLNGIPYKSINKGRRGKRALTRTLNKRMFPLISSRARYRDVFYRFGFQVGDSFESLYNDIPASHDLFASITPPKQDNEQWIALAPFAKHKGKIYPPELMEKVVEEITSWKGTKLFLFGGGENEQAILHNWMVKYNNVISLADIKLGFSAELALLSYCNVMISMDSANMHLASLVNLPVVSIWGATHPYCGFLGWKQKEENSVQLNMTCRPCSVFGNKPCKNNDYYCLAGIPPQLIIASIKRVLTEYSKRQ